MQQICVVWLLCHSCQQFQFSILNFFFLLSFARLHASHLNTHTAWHCISFCGSTILFTSLHIYILVYLYTRLKYDCAFFFAFRSLYVCFATTTTRSCDLRHLWEHHYSHHHLSCKSFLSVLIETYMSAYLAACLPFSLLTGKGKHIPLVVYFLNSHSRVYAHSCIRKINKCSFTLYVQTTWIFFFF